MTTPSRRIYWHTIAFRLSKRQHLHPYESRSLRYESRSLRHESRSLRHESRSLRYESRSLRYESGATALDEDLEPGLTPIGAIG